MEKSIWGWKACFQAPNNLIECHLRFSALRLKLDSDSHAEQSLRNNVIFSCLLWRSVPNVRSPKEGWKATASRQLINIWPCMCICWLKLTGCCYVHVFEFEEINFPLLQCSGSGSAWIRLDLALLDPDLGPHKPYGSWSKVKIYTILLWIGPLTFQKCFLHLC